MDRMIGMALGKGADAIVAMRYDSGEQLGFGVRPSLVPGDARADSVADGRAGDLRVRHGGQVPEGPTGCSCSCLLKAPRTEPTHAFADLGEGTFGLGLF